MILGQNFRFGFYSISPAERMAAIKKAGFDSVMFWWGNEFDSTDGTKEERFNLAKKEGLLVSTVHFPSTNAQWLWISSEEGELYKKQMIQAVQDCGKLGIKNLVIHTTRKHITPEPNESGLEKLSHVLKAAEKEGVKLAIENTRFLRYNSYIYKNLSSSALGFCFDCGHAHCYTPDENPLEMFASYLTTSHIHDNYGPAGSPNGMEAPSGRIDLHNLIGDGNIDYKPIFTRFKELKLQEYNLESYCFEHSKYWGLSMQEFLDTSIKKLKENVI